MAKHIGGFGAPAAGVFAALALAALAVAPLASAEPDYMAEIAAVRAGLDTSLALYEAGDRDGAYNASRAAYLDHYEILEPALRPQAPEHTFEMENHFANLRSLIRTGAPLGDVQQEVRFLQRGLDEDERLVAGAGAAAPAFVFVTSFAIIFREGLEAALLIAAISSFLAASKRAELKKHLYKGAGAAVGASIATWFVAATVFVLAPVDRELMEAGIAVLAVAMLFYVSFWILRRMEQRRWMEFMKAKVWAAITSGNMRALALVAFAAVYREGFETVLFYQAFAFFSKGLELYLLLGFVAGLFALLGVFIAIGLLGAKVPLKLFFGVTVSIAAFLSVSMIGNGVHSLQEADAVGRTVIVGWPVANPYIADFTGYRPTVETLAAQAVLGCVYLAGALYLFVFRREDKAPKSGRGKDPADKRDERPRGDLGAKDEGEPADLGASAPAASEALAEAATPLAGASRVAPPATAEIR